MYCKLSLRYAWTLKVKHCIQPDSHICHPTHIYLDNIQSLGDLHRHSHHTKPWPLGHTNTTHVSHVNTAMILSFPRYISPWMYLSDMSWSEFLLSPTYPHIHVSKLLYPGIYGNPRWWPWSHIYVLSSLYSGLSWHINLSWDSNLTLHSALTSYSVQPAHSTVISRSNLTLHSALTSYSVQPAHSTVISHSNLT